MADEEEGLIDTLKIAAIAMHEVFISLIEAGFTEAQSLYIVSQGIRKTEK